MDPQWLAGFASGDGSFAVKVASSDTTKIGKRVQLRFSIGLNIRELELIKGIAAYLNLGSSQVDSKYIYLTEEAVNLQVINFSAPPQTPPGGFGGGAAPGGGGPGSSYPVFCEVPYTRS
jgi:hypothetical protein